MIPSKQRRPTRLATPLMVAVVVACAGAARRRRLRRLRRRPGRGRSGHPEGRHGLRGVDRLARRLRQRRDPPADRGLRAAAGLPGRLRRQGRRDALRDRSAPVPGDLRSGEGHARPVRGDARQREDDVDPLPAARRREGDQPAGARRRRDATSARPRQTSRRAQASLEKAKLDLGWTKVVSPIDGIAGVAKSQVGDLVTKTTVMTTVSQVDPIKVYFNPSEQEYLAWVAKHGPPEKSITADQSLETGAARAHPLRRLGFRAPRQAVPGRPRGRRQDRHDPARGGLPESRQPAAARPVRARSASRWT